MSQTLAVIILLLLSSVTSFPVPGISTSEAVRYLTRYGYLSDSQSVIDYGTLSSAIASLQEFFGLNITGLLDNDTAQLMRAPRCGVMDVPTLQPETHRNRRYVLIGAKWKIKEITYRIKNGPSQGPLNKRDLRKVMAEAFSLWSSVTPLTFTEQPSKKPAHMDILFAKGEHGDGNAFDGRGATLAHAYGPSDGGSTHFDDDEYFTHKSHRGIDLLAVAGHEFGHALGLHHSKNKDALMYAMHTKKTKVKLHWDDIKGIQALYGESNNLSSEDEVSEVKGKPNAALCKDPKVDIMFSQHGELYAIKGKYLYHLVKGGVAPGYPQPFSALWKKIPTKIDAIVASTKGLIFFSGSNIYVSVQDTDASSPVPISSVYNGAPNDVEAVAAWNGYTYFFKGDKFWVIDMENNLTATEDSPKSLSSFKGLNEKKVDSVLIHHQRLYFLCGHQHYLIDSVAKQVVNIDSMKYPQPNGPAWFGCT